LDPIQSNAFHRFSAGFRDDPFHENGHYYTDGRENNEGPRAADGMEQDGEDLGNHNANEAIAMVRLRFAFG